ncbi:MAG: hypothetical protein ACF8TS_06005 [Maioricimonas sp. JB049]
MSHRQGGTVESIDVVPTTLLLSHQRGVILSAARRFLDITADLLRSAGQHEYSLIRVDRLLIDVFFSLAVPGTGGMYVGLFCPANPSQGVHAD